MGDAAHQRAGLPNGLTVAPLHLAYHQAHSLLANGGERPVDIGLHLLLNRCFIVRKGDLCRQRRSLLSGHDKTAGPKRGGYRYVTISAIPFSPCV